MNDRIRELAEQCGFVYDENFGLTADVNADAAKFAELIVKDIMILLPEDCQVEDGRHLYWVLKDRYGVE